MIAAIYARRSTEQNVATDAKSVTRQVENGTAFAQKRGWTVSEAHIYVDDGVSGAEFERRPGFMRLITALRPRPPFQLLIVSELKSLGREQYETNGYVKKLAEAGVEIFEYQRGRSLTPKDWREKALSNLESASAEAAVAQASERVTEAHSRHHRAGHVTGGRVFGYRNETIYTGVDVHGRPLKSHVERIIDEPEAAVVRRIFELYDGGLGLKAIAKLLTQNGALSPKPARRADGLAPVTGWAPSTVRDVLSRELYHGVAVWFKTRKKNDRFKRDPSKRPESEWQRTIVEHLRIIEEPLWERVQARRRDAKDAAGGRKSGRPRKDAVQNLLAGLATCGVCGGGLVVEQSNNHKGRYSYYVCSRRRHHGSCANRLRMPVAEMNEAVLQAIEEHALTPEAVESVVALTERDDVHEKQRALQRERKDVEQRIKRLVAFVETAETPPTSLEARLRELEARRSAINSELRRAQPVPRLPRPAIESRLEEWRRQLRQSTTQGRAVLQRVLRGRIVFTPTTDDYPFVGKGYTFEAPTRFDQLFSGIVVERPSFIPYSNEGTEHIGLEDTNDGDYGRLLEQVHQSFAEKGWRARQDSNLRPPA